ncbi:MAG: putative protein YpbG [Fimbriimonadaceae bacterium]|nr:putative protein YpbG [Fimbriimonadaceae bacterium]
MRKITRREAFGLGIAGVASVACYQFGSADRIRVERHELRVPRWSADGFKVALLTDLHVDSAVKYERAIEAWQLAFSERPDAILLGGDFISDSSPVARSLTEKTLRLCASTSTPTYGVLGNHDYWAGIASETIPMLAAALASNRSGLLRNETVEIDGVTICGIDDGLVDRDRHDRLSPSNDRNVICLFHEPDFVDRIDSRASIMLAGHSHGGQICLPFGLPLHMPKGARTYIAGFYDLDPVPLYVSRGIGTIGPDRRLFCPPEVTILTLWSG